MRTTQQSETIIWDQYKQTRASISSIDIMVGRAHNVEGRSVASASCDNVADVRREMERTRGLERRGRESPAKALKTPA
jgi:hypothetical protein